MILKGSRYEKVGTYQATDAAASFPSIMTVFEI